MIGLCDNCALKYADCKGNKDVEKCRCDYYKKPVVMNVKELAERVAELELITRRCKWIPTSERLPEEGQHVICCTDDKKFADMPVGTCVYENAEFHTIYHFDINITAWMPLPEPYKEVDAK